MREIRLTSRHFRHAKRRGKARIALKRLIVITDVLLRELQNKLPEPTLKDEEKRFALYECVLAQHPKDNKNIYSLYEPDVYLKTTRQKHNQEIDAGFVERCTL